jgi:hypothetical protein
MCPVRSAEQVRFFGSYSTNLDFLSYTTKHRTSDNHSYSNHSALFNSCFHADYPTCHVILLHALALI